MADDDSGLDPTPVGSTWGIGNTAVNPDDPLNDWASNLHRDDLARFLQDPDAQAADWASRGHPPPDAATMDAIHAHNEANGTPSKSTRFDTTPASPLDSGAPIRMNPDGSIAGNITSPTDPDAPKHGKRGLYMGASPFPGGASTEGPNMPPAAPPGTVYIPGQGWVQRPVPQPSVPTPPSPAGTGTPTPPPAPPPPPPAAAPPAPVAQPSATTPPGASFLKPGEDEAVAKAAEDTTADKKEPTEDKVKDALSTLGKAMQGVKAPEPLKPPAGFAPAPRGPLAAGAPQLAGLLGLAAGGRPSLPILKLLGRV